MIPKKYANMEGAWIRRQATKYGMPKAGKNSLPQGKAYQFVIQCQVVNPELLSSQHRSNTVERNQAAFVYLGILTHVCAHTRREERER